MIQFIPFYSTLKLHSYKSHTQINPLSVFRFTEQECDEMFNGAPVDPKGRFNYVEFTRIIKHGSKEE